MAASDLDVVLCSYCTMDAATIYIRCRDCANELILCLECFASGATPGSHETDHSYEIVDNGTFSILSPGWSAAEEILMFESVELCGFGNWEDCAAHVGKRTPEELKQHFEEVCIRGFLGKKFFHENYHANVLENFGGAIAPAQQDACLAHAASDLSVSQQRELGYIPLRGDFDQEEDNDAEQLVSNCSIGHLPHDNDLESNLIMGHIESCVFRLKERERKKTIIQRLRLLSSKQLAEAETGGTEAKRPDRIAAADPDSIFKPFARFMGHEEGDALLKSLQKERQLKARISELQEFRENGITNMTDSYDYRLEVRRREQMKENAVKRKPPTVTGRRSSLAASHTKRLSTSRDSLTSNDFSVSDVSLMVNGWFLSHKELLVCSRLHMKPSHYLAIKGIVIKDHVAKRLGVVSRSTRRFPPWLDRSQRKFILAFLRDCGWLRSS
ncbi:transcriptional adapter 2-beta-like isoform X3 [Oscarella lobularis]|uniref:transcriptional adapter 2-beta-like isoform X3 n=1 Tax=Oscarella lobularis TaxID=121494 RepID=UPI0033144447